MASPSLSPITILLFASLIIFILFMTLDNKKEQQRREKLLEKHGKIDETEKKSFDDSAETVVCSVCEAKNNVQYKYCWHCTNNLTKNTLPKD